jgi:hypothetical protein
MIVLCKQTRVLLASACHPISNRGLSQSSGEPEIKETKYSKNDRIMM